MRDGEGYIKYSVGIVDGPPPDLSRFPGLSRLRTELHVRGLIGVTPDGVGFGNVSALMAGGPEFVITGTATGGYRELPEELWTTVLSVDMEANRLLCRGRIPASSEGMTHAAVYLGQPEARVVVHIHHSGLYEALSGTDLPATPHNAAFGTPEMAIAVRALARESGRSGIIVMGGHQDGLLYYGTHPDEVLGRIFGSFRSSGI